jgi:hypothetical protein
VYEQVAVGSQTVGIWIDASASADIVGPQLWPSFGEYPVYDETLYEALTNDTIRNDLFRRALALVSPNKRVLDIGTGQYLIWAVESLRAGADHVVAVESMPETHAAAAKNLSDWELESKVSLRHGLSTQLDIEERAEVCVSETIGSVAGAEGAAAIVLDARQRLLDDSGVVVPNRCITKAVATSFDGVMARTGAGFARDAIGTLTRIFEWNESPFDVRLRISNPAKEALLSTYATIEILDFNGDLQTEQRHSVTLVMQSVGVVDGLLAWMEMSCWPGLPILSAIQDRTNWATVYFPLFDTPIEVTPGDRLDVNVAIVLSDDGIHPDYCFDAELYTASGRFSSSAIFKHHGHDFRWHAIHKRLFSKSVTDQLIAPVP